MAANTQKIKKLKAELAEIGKEIDALFTQAQADISKANELKAELDKWNVYKDYEDRFLDLFRRGKLDNN